MGVWIETTRYLGEQKTLGSHPVWVCGLKRKKLSAKWFGCKVTPCMGVWIETTLEQYYTGDTDVTPCMGVWIETLYDLKNVWVHGVTPCMGVWIETNMEIKW